MVCLFCQSSSFYSPYEVRSEVSGKTVLYYCCKKCASVSQSPVPGARELEKYYNDYQQIKSTMNPGYLEEQQLASFFAERDKTLKEIGFDISRITGKTNVELGCANGFFLRYLQSRGASTITGIDISRDLLDKITLKEAVCLQGDLTMLPESSIDNLFLFNILEHVRSVADLMEQIVSRLKKGGLLVLEVPLAGFIAGLQKNKWRFLMPDEHLHIPSLKGLKQLLARYNLKITGKTRFGSGYTTGMIYSPLKQVLDRSAKLFSYGDRGAFLCEFTDC